MFGPCQAERRGAGINPNKLEMERGVVGLGSGSVSVPGDFDQDALWLLRKKDLTGDLRQCMTSNAALSCFPGRGFSKLTLGGFGAGCFMRPLLLPQPRNTLRKPG